MADNEIIEASSDQMKSKVKSTDSGNQAQVLPDQVSTEIVLDGKPDSPGERDIETGFSYKVFRKTSLNHKLTLYLTSRDLIVSEGKIDKLQGVLLVDPEYLQDKKVYGQVTLTFRYGREDEEVMGLTFFNEAVMCLAQLYPPYAKADRQDPTTPVQEILMKRLAPNAHAFTMEVAPFAPPSVQLVPAMEYNGAPIGTSYKVKAYIADRPDEILDPNSLIKMGIRVVQRTNRPPLPSNTVYSNLSSTGTSSINSRMANSERIRITEAENKIVEGDEPSPPHAAIEKPFLLSDGRVGLGARLDRAIYAHGDPINVYIDVTNNSSRSVRRIKVFVVQHVDVCMFGNGKFKNVVALVSSQEGCPVGPGCSLTKSYTLKPVTSAPRNWIALEDNFGNTEASLASTIVSLGSGPEDRNVFAIYVSYYVKVKLLISAMGGEVSLKLPFTLIHTNTDQDLVGLPSPVKELPKESCNKSNEKKSQENTSPTEKRDNLHKERDNKDSKKTITEKDISRMKGADLIEHCEKQGLDENKGT